MSRPPLKVDADLAASLRRIGGALEQNRHQYAAIIDQAMAATGAEIAERITEKTAQVTARIADREERRLDRRRRREARRIRQRELDDGAEVPRGIVFATVAIVCLVFAARNPALFWMVFPALGFGMSAATAFGRAAKRRRAERQQGADAAETRAEAASVETPPLPTEAAPPAPPAPEITDPKVARIQALCQKLLAELESGPPIVREVVTEPKATIEGLRKACVETARREQELRGVLAAQDEAALVAERDALAGRVAAERDAIVRERLGQALKALEQQLANRAELVTAATRLEAENTRILYTLENLHMQLLRARSTDMGAPELGGKLRESLRELGTQIDAVAEALEWASTPAASEASAPARSGAAAADASPAGDAAQQLEAERAARAAAARRAQAAKQGPVSR